jgi:hypothetical protein
VIKKGKCDTDYQEESPPLESGLWEMPHTWGALSFSEAKHNPQSDEDEVGDDRPRIRMSRAAATCAHPSIVQESAYVRQVYNDLANSMILKIL